jgi:3-phosphoshikimate 1-carboxyvinyltransferase
MGLLCGVLAGQDLEATLVGDESLQKRPMERLIPPLRRMGARVVTDDGRAPLTVTGRSPLRGIEYIQQVPSAQIKSSVLLAGLNAAGETAVVEKTPTRDHTERMLEWFGAEVKIDKRGGEARITVSGDARLIARDVEVAGDISSAAFFVVAATCLQGSDITMSGMNVNPTRKDILDLLVRLGANVEIADPADVCNEPVATVRVRTALNRTGSRIVLSGPEIAGLIDELPVIAILGTQLENGIEVREAAELRGKETDRISAIVKNLKRMNAVVEEFRDGFRIARSELKGALIDSFGDHRIAMAFTIAGLLADGETEILGSECVNVSFPGFFETLRSIRH